MVTQKIVYDKDKEKRPEIAMFQLQPRLLSELHQSLCLSVHLPSSQHQLSASTSLYLLAESARENTK